MFTAASQVELASRVAQLDFTEIVFGYAIDRMVFGITITVAECVGCFAISLTGLGLFYLSYVNDKRSLDSIKEEDAFYVSIDIIHNQTISSKEKDKHLYEINNISRGHLKNCLSEPLLGETMIKYP